MTFATRWIDRIDAGDRGLLDRWVIADDGSDIARRLWTVVTHAGGAVVTIAAAVVPLLLHLSSRLPPWVPIVTLAVSHVAVQLVKRFVNRPRPAGTPVIRCPDEFSFPSGHATAALAIAVSYALLFPALGVPLVVLGMIVGWSRVALGVHYPGDVLIGQLIALATAAGLELVVPRS